MSYSFSNGITKDGTSVKSGGAIIEPTVYSFDPNVFSVAFGDLTNGIGIAIGNINEDGNFVDVGYGFYRFQRTTIVGDISYNLDINPAGGNVEFNIIKDDEYNYGVNVFNNSGLKSANLYYGKRVETTPGTYTTMDMVRLEANSENAHIWAKASEDPEALEAHAVTVSPTGVAVIYNSTDNGATNGMAVTVNADGVSYKNLALPTSIIIIQASGVGAYINDAAAAAAGVPVNGLYQETGTGYLKLNQTAP
jgi:hypothetical protein